MTTTRRPASRATLTGISSRAWEHPADRGRWSRCAAQGLRHGPQGVSGLINERAVRLALPRVRWCGSTSASSPGCTGCCEVGRDPRRRRAARDVRGNDPFTNAMTIGMDKPIIVLNSSLFDLLDEDELRFVIAHELGHAHQRSRRLPDPALGCCQLGRGVQLDPRWARSGSAVIDRGALRVAAQGRAVGRPGRAARHPGPRRRVPGAHEVRQRLGRPLRARPDVVLRAGPGVPSTPATCATRSSRSSLVERTDPPVRRRPRGRAAALGRLGRLHRSPGRHLPAPRRGRRGQDDRSRRRRATSYSESFETTQDALGKLVHDVAGFFGSAKLWIDEQLRRTRD